MAMAKQRSNPDNSIGKRNNGRYPTNCNVGGNKGAKSPPTTTTSAAAAAPAMDHRRSRTTSGGKGGEFTPSQRMQPASPSQHHQHQQTSASPRTSPGLVAGHYAACKFSEPPSPKALPPPPQHWTSMSVSSAINSPHRILSAVTFKNCSNNGNDIAQQLKVLLKVQA